MARTDVHLDAMLRHLGAAYYDSLHGRATRADVVRALDTVQEHLNDQEQPRRPVPRDPRAIRPMSIPPATGWGIHMAGPARSAT